MPKFKVFNATTEHGMKGLLGYYSDDALTFAGKTVEDYIRAHIKPGQSRALFMQQNSEAIIKAVAADKLQSEGKPSKKAAENYARKINEKYRPLSSKESKERNSRSEALQNKYAVFAAKHQIAVDGIGLDEPDELDRTEMCLLQVDTSPEGIRFNRHIKDLLTSKDPKKVEQAYKEGLDKLLEVDVSQIDLTNDQYLVDHFEELYPIISSASEFANIANRYQKFHPMDARTDRAFFEKLGLMAEIGMQLRTKIDIIASPAYGQLRSEDLLNSPDFISANGVATNEDGDPITGEEALFGDDETADKFYMNGLKQIANSNLLQSTGESPLLDSRLTPQQRAQQFAIRYWEKEQPEVRPLSYDPKTQKPGPYTEPPAYSRPNKGLQDTAAADIKTYKERFDQLAHSLEKTDHWYNALSSSKEYNNLNKCLKEVRESLREGTGKNADRLQKALTNLDAAAKAYQTHVGAEGKNANQKARLGVAKDISDFLLKHPVSQMTSGKSKQDAQTAPKEKAASQPQKSKLPAEEKDLKKKASEKTERLRSEAGKLPEGNIKQLKNAEVACRIKIADALDQKNFNIDSISSELAQMVVGEKLQKELGEKPNLKGMKSAELQNLYRSQADTLKASPAFQQMLASIKKEDIALSLSEDKNPSRLTKRVEEFILKGNQKAMPDSVRKQGPETQKQMQNPPKNVQNNLRVDPNALKQAKDNLKKAPALKKPEPSTLKKETEALKQVQSNLKKVQPAQKPVQPVQKTVRPALKPVQPAQKNTQTAPKKGSTAPKKEANKQQQGPTLPGRM